MINNDLTNFQVGTNVFSSFVILAQFLVAIFVSIWLTLLANLDVDSVPNEVFSLHIWRLIDPIGLIASDIIIIIRLEAC